MSRKILIVDDNAINRQMLINALYEDYSILEAENGREALTLIHRNYKMLSAVLLDILMPEMDGYEVLRCVRDNMVLAQIPVIMVTGSEEETSRVKALSLGANDFISKPFNPEIVRHCLRNNIALRETASILNAIQRDKLTGLYNRESFFEKVDALIKEREAGYYILSCFDIDNFKLINDQYGAAEGDRILRKIGKVIRANIEDIKGIAARISADNFAALFPVDQKDQDILVQIQEKGFSTFEQQSIVFSIGRYLITDLTLQASAIYDRAYIAKQSVKGRYDQHMAYFDNTMLEKLVRDKQITSEMEIALDEGQFEVWFQPQYNHVTGALVGAEALVRWRHPIKGIISPGEFIPLFEENGFIYEMDKYVWKEVCRYLRKWLDEGRDPLPISMNISRYDIFRLDLLEVITGLVREYEIPIELLRLEVTESAFAKSTSQIVEIVKQLIGLGFTIEIDDFGSGYSSLNTLKNVPAQVIKLDMRFLEGDGDGQRGGNILESIVRMTKWLGMSVIAEGVETKKQGDFLKSIGCSHVQGFLYARPMLAKEYEAHCRSISKEEHLLTFETVEHLNNDMFWNPESMDTLIFNSYVGAACIYEYHNGNIEFLRATDKYASMLGSSSMTVEDILKLDLINHMDAKSCVDLRKMIEEAAHSKIEITNEFLFIDLPGCPSETYLRSTMRVIAYAGDSYLVYCISENITEQYKERQKTEKLQAVMENLPCGVGICVINEGDIHMTYLNKKHLAYFGKGFDGSKISSVFGILHPDDIAMLREAMNTALKRGGESSCVVRIRNESDDGYSPFRISGIAMEFKESNNAIYVTFMPITYEEISFSEMLPVALETVMASSTDLSFIKDKNLKYICCSRSFAHMVGLEHEKDVVGKSDHDLFEKSFADQYIEDDLRLMESGESIIDMVESIPSEDGKLRFSSTSKYLMYDSFGNFGGLYGTGRDVTRIREAEIQQKFLINSIPGGVATYEGIWSNLDSINLTYFSDGFCELFGYTREEYEKLGKKNPTGLVAKADLPGLVNQISNLVQKGTPIDYIYRAHTKSNDYVWIHIKAVLGGHHGKNMTVNAVLFDVTERQNALEKLRVSEEENRMAIRHSKNVVCRYDVAAQTLRLSPGVNPIFGLQPVTVDVPHGEVKSGRISPETAKAYIDFYESIMSGAKSGSAAYQRKSKIGWRWIEARSSTIFSSEGKPVSAVISFVDATDNYEKDAAYKKWLQSLRNREQESYSMFRCNVSKKTTFDAIDGTLMNISFKHNQFFNFDNLTSEYVAKSVFEEDAESFSRFLNVDALMEKYYCGNRIITLEYREKLSSGDYRWLCLTVDLVECPHSADIEAYMLFENIDETKRMELLTIERAETDPLTGVLNRTSFAEKTNHLIRASKPHAQHALLLLDIDGFKLVNDTFGHAAGDQALIDIANLMRRALHRDDLAGRMGGDEFVVFLNDIPGEKIVKSRAAQLCELSHKVFSTDVKISGNVGITIFPHDGMDFETLYKKAEEALYYAKASGKNRYALYREGMENEKPAAESATRQGSVNIRAKKRGRMLIVEDNRLDYELLANMFKDEFIIENARDGNAALVRMNHYGSAISVVLLDLIMPGMDGFEVLEKMRERTELSSIPVVVVSGDTEREASLRAIRAGASDFVLKPVDPEVLRIRIQSAISKAENERLRARNSFLELQNSERSGYKTMLDRIGFAVIEKDWGKDAFIYSPSISNYLAGKYDSRSLWHILLSDLVGEAQDVREMQQLVHRVADDRRKMDGSIKVQLKAASGKKHWFRMDVYKLVNEYGLTDKIIITLKDIDA